MTSDEIAKLDRIGFLWHFADKLEERWQENCRNLKAYKLEHADCNVPKVSPPPDQRASNFVKVQRRNYRLDKLKPHRKAQLKEIGFEWLVRKSWDPNRASTKKDEKWDMRYLALCTFQEEYSHCMVPSSYDRELGSWVQIQRQNHKEGTLSQDRVQWLNEIGFVWRIDHDDPDCSLKKQEWECSKHGYLPCSHATCDNRQLVTWVVNQRSMHGMGRLRPDRKQRLDQLGLSWDIIMSHRGARAVNK